MKVLPALLITPFVWFLIGFIFGFLIGFIFGFLIGFIFEKIISIINVGWKAEYIWVALFIATLIILFLWGILLAIGVIKL